MGQNFGLCKKKGIYAYYTIYNNDHNKTSIENNQGKIYSGDYLVYNLNPGISYTNLTPNYIPSYCDLIKLGTPMHSQKFAALYELIDNCICKKKIECHEKFKFTVINEITDCYSFVKKNKLHYFTNENIEENYLYPGDVVLVEADAFPTLLHPKEFEMNYEILKNIEK